MFELIHLRTPPASTVTSTPPTPTVVYTPIISFLDLWHSRLGHVSFDGLQSLASTGQL